MQFYGCVSDARRPATLTAHVKRPFLEIKPCKSDWAARKTRSHEDREISSCVRFNFWYSSPRCRIPLFARKTRTECTARFLFDSRVKKIVFELEKKYSRNDRRRRHGPRTVRSAKTWKLTTRVHDTNRGHDYAYGQRAAEPSGCAHSRGLRRRCVFFLVVSCSGGPLLKGLVYQYLRTRLSRPIANRLRPRSVGLHRPVAGCAGRKVTLVRTSLRCARHRPRSYAPSSEHLWTKIVFGT